MKSEFGNRHSNSSRLYYVFTLFALIIGGLTSLSAEARMEYALKHQTSTCMGCHVSPFGGGPRNIDGKMYGSRHSSWPSQLSQQSWVSADVRSMAYYPKNGTSTRQGLALMTSTASVALPVKEDPLGSKLMAVGAYSFGVVLTGPREIYGQWQSAPLVERPFIIQFGRFNAPFGLLTDEHRTFTRLLTKTGIFDYEMGASVSGDFPGQVHWDLAFTNGLASGGNFNSNSPANEDSTQAGFANLRWMPPFLPIVLGGSAGYHDRLPQYRDPFALAVYGGVSLDRLTGNLVGGSILAEGVYAEHWSDADLNGNIGRYFISSSDTVYTDAVRNAPTVAWNVLFNLDLADSFVAQYKLESLTFDPSYSGDRYLRHGLGLKGYIDSNIITQLRYEWADIGQADVKNTNVYAAQDAFWLLVQLWL